MTKNDLIKMLKDPPADRRGKPFWAWNGDLTAEEIRRQVRVMKQMGFGGFFMHSRAGLITEYLGTEWFSMVEAAVDEAERCGMEAWLYDEDRWPSGSAGGMVTTDPAHRMKSLVLTEMSPRLYAERGEAIRAEGGFLCAFAAIVSGINTYGYKMLREGFDAESWYSENELRDLVPKTAQRAVLVFKVLPDRCSSEYNGATYTDTMSRAATERFIELTHEKYKAHFGDRFGGVIKGIFTDEPHRGHGMDDTVRHEDGTLTCSLAWTDDIFEQFERRYGYDAKRRLPEIFYRVGGEKVSDVRHDWFDLACNLFNERFAEPINRWCENNGLIFTGHVLHEDSLTNQTVPNGSVMRFYEHMGYPGVDVLTEENRCYWVVKQLSSVARQMGQRHMLSELYGVTGWQFDMKGHKAVGDWQALFGIDLRCPHLSWYTMEGEAKRDYPASILHQSPWYPYYDTVETYFARFGTLVSESEPWCDLLVINPIESAFSIAHVGWSKWIYSNDPAASALERHYTELFGMLTSAHIDFDYGEEQMMERLASVERDTDGCARLIVGKAAYKAVLVSGLLTVRSSTLRLLRNFSEAGGTVIFAGDIPEYVDARRSEEAAELAAHSVSVPFTADAVCEAVRSASDHHVSVELDGAECADVLVRAGTLERGSLYLAALVNTDRKNGRDNLLLRIKTDRALRVERWDLMDGARYSVDCAEYSGGYISVKTSLPAAGSAFYILTAEHDSSLSPEPECGSVISEIALSGSYEYTLSEPNACVLDFARWRFGDGEWHSAEEVLRIDRHIRDIAGIEYRGGGMLQPWYAKKLAHPPYGTAELEYEFYIEAMPRSAPRLVIERPQRWRIAVNGRPMREPPSDEFWIDNCFSVIPLDASCLRFGRNTVTVSTEYSDTSGIEALYLIGSFGVSVRDHTATLCTLPDKLGFEQLAKRQLPFYTGEISYRIPNAELSAALPDDPEVKLMLSVDAFTGAMLIVRTSDGERRLMSDPYEADITDAVRRGEDVTLTLVPTRRNLFGPLHLSPPHAPSYGPGRFVSEGEHFDERYMLIENGITSVSLRLRGRQEGS